MSVALYSTREHSPPIRLNNVGILPSVSFKLLTVDISGLLNMLANAVPWKDEVITKEASSIRDTNSQGPKFSTHIQSSL